ncbi:MAG: class I SAM-dependent methyltransferase [Alphaproteobacteria bacterium]
MKQPFAHPMMPQAAHDELAREHFVVDLKIHMEEDVYPVDAAVYEKRALPRFKKENGRAPETHHEVRKLMEREPSTKLWSAMARTIQEMLWDGVGNTVERQLPDLIASSQVKKPLGTLTLDPDLKVPRYNGEIDIHCMPGGYHTDLTDDDVFAGAIYDRGAYYYVAGLLGRGAHAIDDQPDNKFGLFLEYQGRATIAYIKQRYPDLKPKRILDMGCTIGGSTLPYANAFPDAEIYAIDVGAPSLRYAHARAEYFGKKIHFMQQSAEGTNFPDGHFDLVLSHGLLHETATQATKNILKEANRLLAPGGVTMHADPQFDIGLNLHDQFMHDWDTRYNAEPFWGKLHDMKPKDLMRDAGFPTQNVTAVWMTIGQDGNPAFPAVKDDPELSNLGRGIIFGAHR